MRWTVLSIFGHHLAFTTSIVADISSFPRGVAETLHELATPSLAPLSSPCRWYLESLQETDPFKAFLWAFFAMESAVNHLEKHYRALERLRAESKVQEPTRAAMIAAGVAPKDVDLTTKTPFLKSAVVAPELSAALAEDWLKEFKAVKVIRGKLAHANEAERDQIVDYRNRSATWLKGDARYRHPEHQVTPAEFAR